MSNSCVRRGLVVLAALATLGAANANPVDAGQRVVAIWKTQLLRFEYRSLDTLYSCDTLQQRLGRILLSLGAREGIRLRSYGCTDLSGFARFQIALESPVEATAENVQEITSYDSQDILIARLRGERLDGAEDVHRFPAVWRMVSFGRDGRMRLARGDCELVEQLRRQVLPKLSIRILSGRADCPFGRGGPPGLRVLALVPASIDVASTSRDSAAGGVNTSQKEGTGVPVFNLP